MGRVCRIKPCITCGSQDFTVDKHNVARCWPCRVRIKRAGRSIHGNAAGKAITRANKAGVVPEWLTDDDRWLIKEVYHLSSLRTALTGVQHNVDHVIPLRGESVCGLHVPTNLQVITHRDNALKRNIYPVD